MLNRKEFKEPSKELLAGTGYAEKGWEALKQDIMSNKSVPDYLLITLAMQYYIPQYEHHQKCEDVTSTQGAVCLREIFHCFLLAVQSCSEEKENTYAAFFHTFLLKLKSEEISHELKYFATPNFFDKAVFKKLGVHARESELIQFNKLAKFYFKAVICYESSDYEEYKTLINVLDQEKNCEEIAKFCAEYFLRLEASIKADIGVCEERLLSNNGRWKEYLAKEDTFKKGRLNKSEAFKDLLRQLKKTDYFLDKWQGLYEYANKYELKFRQIYKVVALFSVRSKSKNKKNIAENCFLAIEHGEQSLTMLLVLDLQCCKNKELELRALKYCEQLFDKGLRYKYLLHMAMRYGTKRPEIYEAYVMDEWSFSGCYESAKNHIALLEKAALFESKDPRTYVTLAVYLESEHNICKRYVKKSVNEMLPVVKNFLKYCKLAIKYNAPWLKPYYYLDKFNSLDNPIDQAMLVLLSGIEKQEANIKIMQSSGVFFKAICELYLIEYAYRSKPHEEQKVLLEYMNSFCDIQDKMYEFLDFVKELGANIANNNLREGLHVVLKRYHLYNEGFPEAKRVFVSLKDKDFFNQPFSITRYEKFTAVYKKYDQYFVVNNLSGKGYDRQSFCQNVIKFLPFTKLAEDFLEIANKYSAFDNLEFCVKLFDIVAYLVCKKLANREIMLRLVLTDVKKIKLIKTLMQQLDSIGELNASQVEILLFMPRTTLEENNAAVLLQSVHRSRERAMILEQISEGYTSAEQTKSPGTWHHGTKSAAAVEILKTGCFLSLNYKISINDKELYFGYSGPRDLAAKEHFSIYFTKVGYGGYKSEAYFLFDPEKSFSYNKLKKYKYYFNFMDRVTAVNFNCAFENVRLKIEKKQGYGESIKFTFCYERFSEYVELPRRFESAFGIVDLDKFAEQLITVAIYRLTNEQFKKNVLQQFNKFREKESFAQISQEIFKRCECCICGYHQLQNLNELKAIVIRGNLPTGAGGHFYKLSIDIQKHIINSIVADTPQNILKNVPSGILRLDWFARQIYVLCKEHNAQKCLLELQKFFLKIKLEEKVIAIEERRAQQKLICYPMLNFASFDELRSDPCGSNSGKIYWSKITKQKVFIKLYNGRKDQVCQEMIAYKLYQTTGINTAKYFFIEGKGNSVGVASFWLESFELFVNCKSEKIEANTIDKSDLIIHAWLANWDAVSDSNVGLCHKKLCYLDFGGSLEYRAQGERKPHFGYVVSELETMLNFQINKSAATFFSGISLKDKQKGAEKLASISDHKIIKIVLANGGNRELALKLVGRKMYIIEEVLNNKILTEEELRQKITEKYEHIELNQDLFGNFLQEVKLKPIKLSKFFADAASDLLTILNDKKVDLTRMKHGLLHMVRCVLRIPKIHRLYKMAAHPGVEHISNDVMKIMKIVAFYHDFGRLLCGCDHGIETEEARVSSTEKCFKSLISFGLSLEQAQFFAELILYKNDILISDANLLLKYLYNADQIGTLRSHQWRFKVQYNMFYREYALKRPDLIKELEKLIIFEGFLIHKQWDLPQDYKEFDNELTRNFIPSNKGQLEADVNCYQATKNISRKLCYELFERKIPLSSLVVQDVFGKKFMEYANKIELLLWRLNFVPSTIKVKVKIPTFNLRKFNNGNFGKINLIVLSEKLPDEKALELVYDSFEKLKLPNVKLKKVEFLTNEKSERRKPLKCVRLIVSGAQPKEFVNILETKIGDVMARDRNIVSKVNYEFW